MLCFAWVSQVQVYSSCPSVELLVNGASRGRQPLARYLWGEWSFPYEAGNLTAVGFDGPPLHPAWPV